MFDFLSFFVKCVNVRTDPIFLLSDEKAQAVAVISSDSKKRQLLVRFVTAQAIPADKSLELWAVAKDGKVKSLGLVANTLAVSLEQKAAPVTQKNLAARFSSKEVGCAWVNPMRVSLL